MRWFNTLLDIEMAGALRGLSDVAARRASHETSQRKCPDDMISLEPIQFPRPWAPFSTWSIRGWP